MKEEQVTQNRRRGDQVSTAIFWGINILVALIIFSITVYHGQDSPFNTLIGKSTFAACFVGIPVYVYLRLSNIVGFTLSLSSLILWTIGLRSLIELVMRLGKLLEQ